MCNNFSNEHRQFFAAITKIVKPRFLYEAVKDPKWEEAMAAEIEALKVNKTWSIINLPAGRKPINYKWVYKVQVRWKH